MPNYTKNTLIVKGLKEALLYFYNRNRVTEEDVENVGGCVTDLSFEKCVTRENDSVIIQHIQEHYISKNKNTGWDGWDLTCAIWGTKWDAIEPIIDLSNIENGEISYRFDTAWSYPYGWLMTVSKIFRKLEFENISLDEYDNYDMCHKHHFKEGKFEEVESYSRLERSISKYGMDNLVNMMISYCEEKKSKIANYLNRFETIGKELKYVDWKEFCKLYMETENKEDDRYETDLFYYVLNGSEDLENFIEENDLYRQLFESKELSQCFFKKVKDL
jgi:hypothetical protein